MLNPLSPYSIVFDLVEWSKMYTTWWKGLSFPVLDVQLVLPIELWHWTGKKNWSYNLHYILGQIYCILHYFGLLHFTSKVITFWVNMTLFLHQKLLYFGLLLHFASIITFCGLTRWVFRQLMTRIEVLIKKVQSIRVNKQTFTVVQVEQTRKLKAIFYFQPLDYIK